MTMNKEVVQLSLFRLNQGALLNYLSNTEIYIDGKLSFFHKCTGYWRSDSTFVRESLQIQVLEKLVI